MQRTATPARAAAVVVLLVMVVIEAFAMRAGTLGVLLIAVVAALAVVVIVSRADPVKVGLAATVLSAFTLTWNGWYVGPIRPGDILPFVALLAFAIARPASLFRAPPWWIKQLVVGLVLLLFVTILFPTSLHYLNSRVVVGAGGELTRQNYANFAGNNIAIIAKFIVAIAVVPIVFAAAARIDRRIVRRLATAFCLGSALSGLVAFIDHTGVASLGQLITGEGSDSDRTAGFTTHPNFLAEVLVLAAPFACWLLTSRLRWERWAGGIALVSAVLGVYASGSRGGTACIVGSIALTFLLLPRTRPHFPTIALGAITAGAVIAVALPGFGLQILKVTRIYGSTTTEGSDTVRDLVARQGTTDFLHYPVKGIGMQASTDASQVYLQQLASGGLLLFIVMSVYLLGAAFVSFRLIARTPIAAAVCAAVLIKIPLNLVETSLTDRLYYVQEAVLAAILAVVLTRRDPDTDDEFDPAYVPSPELDPTVHQDDTDAAPVAAEKLAVSPR